MEDVWEKLSEIPDASETTYRNDPKFSDSQVWINSVDSDLSDQGLHCLQLSLHLLDISLYERATLFKF